MSFIEFNYMCLQAYDFVELNKRFGCVLQMGGSDQWGNIVTGIDLGRRMGTEQLYALTSPLITTASGAKMGKTAAGAVWLDEKLLPPFEYWQFWRNTEDRDVGRFLRLFTELPLGEIERLESLEGAEINEAKKVLANEATALVHGREAAERAAEAARQTFEQGAVAQRSADGDDGCRGIVGRSRRAFGFRESRPRLFDRRRAASDQRRRTQGQRQNRNRRACDPIASRSQRCRRNQAVARPQTSRAVAAAIG